MKVTYQFRKDFQAAISEIRDFGAHLAPYPFALDAAVEQAAALRFSAIEANLAKVTITDNAIQAVNIALELTGNHGLSRQNPLERHYRNVLCGRVHTPQSDSAWLAAGNFVFQSQG